MIRLLNVALAFILITSSAFAASSYDGKWETASGTAVFHDDNRGPIPYENCGIKLTLKHSDARLLFEVLAVDCKITDDMPFSHEVYALDFEIRGDALLENGQKVGTITESLISFDYADVYEGIHYIDIDRTGAGDLQLAWSYRSDLFQGFDVSAKTLVKR